MKYLYLILAILLTAINTFRYNLPPEIYKISVFDLGNTLAMFIAMILTLGKDKNVLTKGFLVYNLLGCLDSIIDELAGTANFLGTTDKQILIVTILISILYMVYRVKSKDEPLL